MYFLSATTEFSLCKLKTLLDASFACVKIDYICSVYVQ